MNMPLFERYKQIIFPDTASQAALLKAINNYGYEADIFDEAYTLLFEEISEHHLQEILGAFLRALAVKHLENGGTEITRTIRDQYNAIISEIDTKEPGDEASFETFLTNQSKNGVYATDLLANSLAELLGVTYKSTAVDSNHMSRENQNITYTGYAAPTANAPVVHLFNQTNVHFFVTEGDFNSTLGDGNCLYNGFAQNLAEHIRHERTNDNTAKKQAYYRLIRTIKTKARSFTEEHADAKQAADTLAKTLKQSFCDYTSNKITYDEFKKQSLGAINASKKHLEPHRDWKNILINLTAAIFGLGIPLMYNRATKGYWFFKMPTDLSNDLLNLKEAVLVPT